MLLSPRQVHLLLDMFGVFSNSGDTFQASFEFPSCINHSKVHSLSVTEWSCVCSWTGVVCFRKRQEESSYATGRWVSPPYGAKPLHEERHYNRSHRPRLVWESDHQSSIQQRFCSGHVHYLSIFFSCYLHHWYFSFLLVWQRMSFSQWLRWICHTAYHLFPLLEIPLQWIWICL